MKLKPELYFSYSTPKGIQKTIKDGYLAEDGLLFDFSGLPEDYEVVVRDIHNSARRTEYVIYQNLKNRE
jgi:hypothetical protein